MKAPYIHPVPAHLARLVEDVLREAGKEGVPLTVVRLLSSWSNLLEPSPSDPWVDVRLVVILRRVVHGPDGFALPSPIVGQAAYGQERVVYKALEPVGRPILVQN